jgi:hypothetical protein
MCLRKQDVSVWIGLIWHSCPVAGVCEDISKPSGFIKGWELLDQISYYLHISIVSDYGLDDRGSIPDRDRGFFF